MTGSNKVNNDTQKCPPSDLILLYLLQWLMGIMMMPLSCSPPEDRTEGQQEATAAVEKMMALRAERRSAVTSSLL
jgi:hypothetical protein